MQLPVLISPDQVVPAPKGSVKGALNADLERHTSMSHRGDRAVGVDEVVRNRCSQNTVLPSRRQRRSPSGGTTPESLPQRARLSDAARRPYSRGKHALRRGVLRPNALDPAAGRPRQRTWRQAPASPGSQPGYAPMVLTPTTATPTVGSGQRGCFGTLVRDAGCCRERPF
jgi:hypothetical protein